MVFIWVTKNTQLFSYQGINHVTQYNWYEAGRKKHFHFQVRLQWGDNWWTNSNDRWSRSKESGAECKKLAKTPECPITSLGLFVTESLLCCHHRLAWHTLSSHEKLKLPIRRPASHYMLNQFPFVENFCQKCARAAAGNRRQGTSGEETYCCRCIASTINSDLHFDFYETSILNTGILTSKARRRKMTMMDLTLVSTTLTTTTWTSTKWRCIPHPCMTPRKDPLRGVFLTFVYRIEPEFVWMMVTSRSFSHYLSIESNGCQSKAIDHSKSLPLST